MATIHRYKRAPQKLSLIIPCFLLSFGCIPASSQNSFAPPAPKPVSTDNIALPDPPSAGAGLYANANPNLIPPDLNTPRNVEVETRLRQADEAYRAGQRAYGLGDMDVARREFNRAVDVLLAASETTERGRIERRLEQMIDDVYRYDVNGLGSAEDNDKVVYEKSPLDDVIDMTFPVDPGLKSKVKEEVTATASGLPLEATDAVLSYINYFSSERGRRTLIYGMQRSGRYRPMIQRILAEEGVPQELIYLAQIESGFFPRAASYRAAVGMWQFMRFRGREYGLMQNEYADERMDPEKSTRAAARHLHDLYKQFGDWYLAMAAYNCGPGCVESAVARTGYADFWRLRGMGALPRETTNYVPIIVAITIMVKNAKDYGIDNIQFDEPLEYDTVKMDALTNLNLVADAVERPVSEIRDLNPALLRGSAPAGYGLCVPKGTGNTLTAALEMVPENRRAAWRIHKVQPGETLASIARQFGTAPAVLAAANNSLLDAPAAGETLLVPVVEPKPAARASARRAPVRTTAAVRRPAQTRKASYPAVAPRVLNKKAAVKTAAAR